ncbi:MAG: nucleotide pyrophosphohydrolase [Coriobacteriales bacterium]|nr:nucleotide pyrophosphohydrolase [Coriobacteriales bacterium]
MTFEEAAEKALAFREERDWEQFHNPKDLAISISLEAAELLECFQWSGTDLDAAEKREHMAEELADIVLYCTYFAQSAGINLPEAMSHKVDLNAQKYPVEASRGSSKKYTEL